jgi:hypothetical protein
MSVGILGARRVRGAQVLRIFPTQNFADGVESEIDWYRPAPTALWDTDSFQEVERGFRIVASLGGVYRVSCRVAITLAAAVTGRARLRLMVEGDGYGPDEYAQSQGYLVADANVLRLPLMIIRDTWILETDPYTVLTARLTQWSGAARALAEGEFSIEWLGRRPPS